MKVFKCINNDPNCSRGGRNRQSDRFNHSCYSLNFFCFRLGLENFYCIVYQPKRLSYYSFEGLRNFDYFIDNGKHSDNSCECRNIAPRNVPKEFLYLPEDIRNFSTEISKRISGNADFFSDRADKSGQLLKDTVLQTNNGVLCSIATSTNIRNKDLQITPKGFDLVFKGINIQKITNDICPKIFESILNITERNTIHCFQAVDKLSNSFNCTRHERLGSCITVLYSRHSSTNKNASLR